MLGRETADSEGGNMTPSDKRCVSVEEQTAVCTSLFTYYFKNIFSLFLCYCQEHYSRFKEELRNSEVGDRKLDILSPFGCICGRPRRAGWSNTGGWPIHIPGGTEFLYLVISFLKFTGE